MRAARDGEAEPSPHIGRQSRTISGNYLAAVLLYGLSVSAVRWTVRCSKQAGKRDSYSLICWFISEPFELMQLVRLQAEGASSPLALTRIMHV